MERVGATALKEPAQIAVGENAEQFARGLNRGQAEALCRHLVNDLRHRCVGRHDWQIVAGVHQLLHGCQAAAELSSWMEFGKVPRLEVEAATDVDGQSVTERKHCGRRRCGCELVVAGLAVNADVEYMRAGFGQC